MRDRECARDDPVDICSFKLVAILVFADGDAPGREFANSLSRELPVTTVSFGDGEDVNSAYTKYGVAFLKEKMGLTNEE